MTNSAHEHDTTLPPSFLPSASQPQKHGSSPEEPSYKPERAHSRSTSQSSASHHHALGSFTHANADNPHDEGSIPPSFHAHSHKNINSSHIGEPKNSNANSHRSSYNSSNHQQSNHRQSSYAAFSPQRSEKAAYGNSAFPHSSSSNSSSAHSSQSQNVLRPRTSQPRTSQPRTLQGSTSHQSSPYLRDEAVRNNPRNGENLTSSHSSHSSLQRPASYAPHNSRSTHAVQPHTPLSAQKNIHFPHSIYKNNKNNNSALNSQAAAFAAYSSSMQPNNNNVKKHRKKHRILSIFTSFFLIFLIAAAIISFSLYRWVDGQLQRTPWLTNHATTSATSWLILGTDVRDGTAGGPKNSTMGSRTDTILVLTKPAHGHSALISIPRDSLVRINNTSMKINAVAENFGKKALVSQVETLMNQKINHVAQIQFGGLQRVVNAIGGIDLCYDRTVHDPDSNLNWTAGCHHSDGPTALAFARMRYADPHGDFGRAQRQRQVIRAIMKKALSLSSLTNVSLLNKVAHASLTSLNVDEKTNPFDLIKMALAFKDATGKNGITGSVYWSNPNYYVPGVGSSVLLDEAKNLELFHSIEQGTQPSGHVGNLAGKN